jgi:hypothetical protein
MKEKEKEFTKIALHGVNNILGKESGIEEIGSSLSYLEFNILTAILESFGETNYEGNRSPIPTNTNPFVKVSPRVRLTKKKLAALLGYQENNKAGMKAAMKSLSDIAEKKINFSYKRLCVDENGVGKKEKGKWKLEQVETTESFFNIIKVYSEDGTRLKYIDINLASIFIDQIDQHYLPIPKSLEHEIKRVSGKKRVTVTTQYLCMYFMRKTQQITKHQSGNSKVSINWKELANILRISKLDISRKRGAVVKKLKESSKICESMGFISKFNYVDDYFHFYLLPPSSRIKKRVQSTSKVEAKEEHNKKDVFKSIILPNGKPISKNSLNRWVNEFSFEEIELSIKLFLDVEKNTKIKKPEAYIQTLLQKREGIKKLKFFYSNREFSKTFKEETNFSSMEILQESIEINITPTYVETIPFAEEPAIFKASLESFFQKWLSQQINSN